MSIDELARGAGASLRTTTEPALDVPGALDETRRTRRRRQRTNRLAGLGLVVAVVVALILAAPALWPDRASRLPTTRVPSPAPSLSPSPSDVPTGASSQATHPALSACTDPTGDSAGVPDLTLVALDRPAWPFIHYHWDGSRLPKTGAVRALFWATSADRTRSRQFVVEIVDGTVVGEYVRDPSTGAQQALDPQAPTDTTVNGVVQRSVMLSARGLGASFPGATTVPLGDGWTWKASISVDGVVVDSCDGKHGSTMSP